MPSFFSNKRLIVLLVGIITVVAVVGVTMQERPKPTWPEQFLRDSIGFVQSIFYKPARGIAGFFENISEMKQIYTENQLLKANLQDNAILVAKIRELEAENNSLKNLLDAEVGLSDYQLRAAEVVTRSPDRWYQQITINKGDTHGVEPDMAVITDKGLVGRVKSVAQFTSTVELLSDTNRVANVSAIVLGDDETEQYFGILEGYDVEQEALYLRKIDLDAQLEEGMSVITSGLGGKYPKGLFVGEIIEYYTDQDGLTRTALVKPAADLYQLDFVFVVESSFVPESTTTTDEELEEETDEEEGEE
ncbi:rod shape-determining protein MreC [Bacillus horti]|uniref:Cell shape-determining protein MreC n=1 Tax=Caldalkalibacillus horti TaxID=77523 RepID=A0ABT9VTG8_9BACI|nr:rod shape-determining protein MreC [Bacillus horti]MDQ0164289.1 rod shape-determining protein MreC [Bacillus horti]